MVETAEGRRQIRKMREAGKQYLAKHPGAFGGGIEPSTGIRRVGGQRVSVAGAGEVPGVGGVPTLEQARAISKPTAPSRRLTPKTSPLATPGRPTPLSKITPLNTPRVGTGAFTRAVDVGGGKMQDVFFRYRNGRIIERKRVGGRFPQTEKFKAREKKEEEKTKKEAGLELAPKEDELKGLERISASTRREAEALTKKADKGKKLTQAEMRTLAFFSFAIPVQETLIGAKNLPGGLVKLAKNPKEIKKLPKAFIKGLIEEGVIITGLAKVDPTLAIARIGGNLFGFKIVGESLEVIGKVSKKASVKINPFVKKVEGDKLKFIGEQKTGKGGEIITNIVFKTDKGRVGFAKGIDVGKGKKGTSIVLGKSGKMSKLPLRKKKIINVQSFVGIEKSITKNKLLKSIIELEKAGKIPKLQAKSLKSLARKTKAKNIKQLIRNIKQLIK